MNLRTTLIVVSLSCFATFAQAAPLLYTGEMVVKKVSGKDCTGKEAGRSKKANLILDTTAGQITGYLWGDFSTGRFSGKEGTPLDLRYAYLNPLIAAGHNITIALHGDTLTARVHERQLAADQEGCNYDDAELKLSASSDDAAAAWINTQARYNAHVVREQGIALYKQEKYTEAIPLYEKALTLREEADGKTAEFHIAL